MVNSKHSSICFKVHVSTSPPGGSLATRRQGKVAYFNQVISLGLFGQGSRAIQPPPTATGRRKPFVIKDSRSQDASSGQKARKSRSTFGQGDLLQIRVTHIEHPTSTGDPVTNSTRYVSPDRGVKIYTPRSNLDPIANTVKFSIDTSPPGRVQPTPPTGT